MEVGPAERPRQQQRRKQRQCIQAAPGDAVCVSADPQCPGGAENSGKSKPQINPFPGNGKQALHTEDEIDHMGDEKAGIIPPDTENRQQEEEQRHIQRVGENIDGHGPLLLAKALGHGIGDGIAVEHGRQQSEPAQKYPCLTVLIQPQTQYIR